MGRSQTLTLAATGVFLTALLIGVLLSRGCGGMTADLGNPGLGSAGARPSRIPKASPPEDRPADLPSKASPQERPEPTLREQFRRHLDRLIHLVDQDGMDLTVYSPAKEEMEFIKKHAAEFKEDVFKIIRERCGNLDPISLMLWCALPGKDIQIPFREVADRWDALVASSKRDPIQFAHVASHIAHDEGQPIGIRIQALLFLTTSRTAGDPALAGVVLSLLDTISEPILRTRLFDYLLSTGDRQPVICSATLERAPGALEKGSEAGGTTVTILSALCGFTYMDNSKFLRETYGPRIESMILSWFMAEVGREAVDDDVLNRISLFMTIRRTIPSTEQTALAEGLLQSDSRPDVRIAAASLLMPRLESTSQDPAVSGFLTYSRTTLLRTLKDEKDLRVANTITDGLARYPVTHQLLAALGDERFDLRSQIDSALRSNPLKTADSSKTDEP